jgi:hypothetical protein
MLHYWDAFWDLRLKECPCDLHFCEYLEAENIRGASIFHFGTGGHHLVGVRTAENGSDNAVLGITASPQGYETYVKLAIDKPLVAKTYKVFFGDIYQLDQRLLPTFDLVTLFHLCEFRGAPNDAYGAMTDLDVTLLLTDKLQRGGVVAFYPGSFAFDNAKKVIAQWETERPVERIGEFKTLLLYRKK